MIKKNHILRFENLSKFSNLTHGFSTRFFGDMRSSHHLYPQAIDKFTKTLEISQQQLVKMNQVHGNRVYLATKKDCGKVIPDTDGLISKEKDIFLGVITADCIPLLFYDPVNHLTAAVHAGWRGLFNEIIKVAVSDLFSKGSNAKDIIVGIGPCIKVCCYSIPKERADQFIEKFPNWEKFISKRDYKLFFDLVSVANDQLQSLGISAENIEDGDYCTFDHEDVYSYRREGEDFGEVMGIIGMLK